MLREKTTLLRRGAGGGRDVKKLKSKSEKLKIVEPLRGDFNSKSNNDPRHKAEGFRISEGKLTGGSNSKKSAKNKPGPRTLPFDRLSVNSHRRQHDANS